MQLVPVIEIRHGKVVHSAPKNKFVKHVVKEDLMDVVGGFVSKGVSRIHIVDVDAIESGEPENVDLIAKVKKIYPEVALQVIGGIKSVESAYVWTDAGVDYLVLNSKAMRQKNLLDDICVEFPNQVLVELDCRHGKVGMGAGKPTFDLERLANQLEGDGVVGLVITEVFKNGHDSGGSAARGVIASENSFNRGHGIFSELSDSIQIPMFANGMIGQVSDLKQLLESRAKKPFGVLIGNSLYNGGFSLQEANQLIAQYRS